MIARMLILTAALGLAIAAPGHAASTKDCGLTSRIDGVRYQVVIETGRSKATCATVVERFRFIRRPKRFAGRA